MIADTTPKEGKIMMYTSGCPKNQNICWNITGSPPPAASKKLVPKYLSVKIMVTAPANTGITAINKNAVINHVQTNNRHFKPGHSWCAHVHDRHDHVDGTHDRTDPHNMNRKNKQSSTVRTIRRRERCVKCPTKVWPHSPSVNNDR